MTDWEDVDKVAKAFAGNWRHFPSFAWFEHPPDSDLWAVVYTKSRDTGLIEESNAAVIKKEMERFTEGDVIPQTHSHFAVGWLEGYAIRVYRDKQSRAITDAFRKWCELQRRLEVYPLLDETDYSQREYDSALSWIKQEGQGLVAPNVREDWAEEVFSWLWNSPEHSREMENRDDFGATPGKESIRVALAELDMCDSGELPLRAFPAHLRSLAMARVDSMAGEEVRKTLGECLRALLDMNGRPSAQVEKVVEVLATVGLWPAE